VSKIEILTINLTISLTLKKRERMKFLVLSVLVHYKKLALNTIEQLQVEQVERRKVKIISRILEKFNRK